MFQLLIYPFLCIDCHNFMCVARMAFLLLVIVTVLFWLCCFSCRCSLFCCTHDQKEISSIVLFFSLRLTLRRSQNRHESHMLQKKISFHEIWELCRYFFVRPDLRACLHFWHAVQLPKRFRKEQKYAKIFTFETSATVFLFSLRCFYILFLLFTIRLIFRTLFSVFDAISACVDV